MSTPDRPEFPPTDDSLQGEIAYLARFLGDRPGTAPIVLRRLGELGDDARIDLARLRVERAVKLRRLPPRSRRRRAAARVAAVMAFVVTGPSLVMAPAVAQELAPAAVVREASLPGIVLRVIDTGTGKPLAGVKVKTVAEEVVAVTDGGGKAMVPAPYAKETVLSLEREGYPIVLVEGEKLAARSMITMRKFADNTPIARGPQAPSRGVSSASSRTTTGGASAADDPAERLMAIALEHTRTRPIAEPPTLAAAPRAEVAPPTPAVAKVAPPTPAVAKVAPPASAVAKIAPPAPLIAKVEAPTPAAAPKIASAPTSSAPAAAPLPPMARAARAPKRVVKIAKADAKAARSVAVAWEAPRDRADKNVAKVASADAKAPRAIRVVMRDALPGAPAEAESPLGITSDQLAWIPPVPTEQVAGPIPPAPEAPVEAATETAMAPATPVEAGAHIAEPMPKGEGLPFLIGRSAAEAPGAEPAFPVDPEALEPHGRSVHLAPAPVPASDHHASVPKPAPVHHASVPKVAPVHHVAASDAAPEHHEAAPQPVALHLPVAPKPAPVQRVAMAPKPAPAHVAAPPVHPGYHAPAPTADLHGAAPVKHVAPPRASSTDLAFLPVAPRPPAHLEHAPQTPVEAPQLLPPAEGARRFATINLPVRPRFAGKPAPHQVANAPAPAEASPLARVREHLTASRAHMRYEVKAGDMLSTIAQRELGSASLWPVLYLANRDQLTNPRWLQIGVALKIPRTSTGLAAAGAKTYVVQAGDCLSTIAREHLGDMRKWPQVFAANRHLIKNPWLIFPGQRLVLPVYVASGVSESWADLQASAAPPADGPQFAGGGSPRHTAD